MKKLQLHSNVEGRNEITLRRKAMKNLIVTGLAAAAIAAMSVIGTIAHADDPARAKQETALYVGTSPDLPRYEEPASARTVAGVLLPNIAADVQDTASNVNVASPSRIADLFGYKGTEFANTSPDLPRHEEEAANPRSLAAKFGFKGVVFANTSPDLPGYDGGSARPGYNGTLFPNTSPDLPQISQ
jgi:hypothetical protein